jgi:hypothetical protein
VKIKLTECRASKKSNSAMPYKYSKTIMNVYSFYVVKLFFNLA